MAVLEHNRGSLSRIFGGMELWSIPPLILMGKGGGYVLILGLLGLLKVYHGHCSSCVMHYSEWWWLHSGMVDLHSWMGLQESSRNIKWETLWFACRATFECCCFTCRGEVRQCKSIINHTEWWENVANTCTSDILWSQHADSGESGEKERRMCTYFWIILPQTINRVSGVADYTTSSSSIQGECGAGSVGVWILKLLLRVFPLFSGVQAGWRQLKNPSCVCAGGRPMWRS